MRVLLISPLRGIDPPCGDITYTETLLANGPEGVQYETYADAVKRGALVERARRARFWEEPFLTVFGRLVNILRAKGVLFWEPFRFFDVRPGEYDLVHLHVFSAAFRKMDCPLVISSGAPQKDLYLDRRGFGRARVLWTGMAERWLGKILRVNCSSYAMPQAERVMVYTEYFREELAGNGYVARQRVEVIPIMHAVDLRPIIPRVPRRIGFVANNFDEKGGRVLLEAYEQVRQMRRDIELVVVGSEPQMSAEELQQRGIIWMPSVPRSEVVETLMPSFDIFAYPTPHDCFSYVTLEAMAAGCSIATSDYVSMPEAVDYGKAGLISPVGDANGLARNIISLLDPATNLQFRKAAQERFRKYFSCDVVTPRIAEVYQKAVDTWRSGKSIE